ncbi:ArsR/SmtB family transcription factor [Photobacterium lucens]|uniref:ArsR/SmtB family transcription factor n=1 Tax=Photobacterium lucens TaxID=2562949 RepID=UPI00136966D7|nr:metalloregulator ArsR/SmtB family transcription factor [Photobacterium lucens]MBP2699543.1 winged helix-turn-helix transcriptional regulator [Vibrio parahaemolyticus]MZG55167.1 ArsR family transcriptional regulator [Photobacterium lucens]MZG82544.1 ArsR family transcriptional regulator [Photobacterium lucens]
MDQDVMTQNADQAVALLKVISNRTRLMVLCLLKEQERSVSELHEMLGIPQSSLSQNLAVLRQHGCVETRRDAQTIYYSLKSPEIKTLIETLYDLFCANE